MKLHHAVLVAAVVLQACQPSGPRVVEDSPSAGLHRFLESARPGNTSSDRDSIYACPPEGMTSKALILGSFAILPGPEAGDTVVLRSVVTSVARVEPDASEGRGMLVDVGLRTDTLSWQLVRTSPSGTFKVCGYSLEGYGFMRYPEGAVTTWVTPGGSWERVRTLADSVWASDHR